MGADTKAIIRKGTTIEQIKELKSKLILKNNIYTEFPCDPYFLLK